MIGNRTDVLQASVLFKNVQKGNVRRFKVVARVIAKLKQKLQVLTVNRSNLLKQNDIRKLERGKKNVKARLIKSMSPLQHFDYEKQLQIKEELCHRYQLNLRNVLWYNTKRDRLCPELRARLERGGTVYNIPKVTPSPVINDYRNKDHAVIGPGVDGKPTVGFYVMPGKFPNLDIVCGKLDAIKQQHFDVMKAFTECVRSSGIPALGANTNKQAQALGGHWRSMVLRSNREGDLLVTAAGVQWNVRDNYLRQGGYNPELLQRMKEIVINFFEHGVGRSFDVKSIFFQEKPYIRTDPTRFPFQLLRGQPSISERLCGLNFTVSPGSFFQVNTAAAEVMYEKVRQLCQLNKDSIVFDLCCGTGTIGMVLAKYVKLVVGIEEDTMAVQDAIKNAELNNVENIAFISGTAEKKLPGLLKRTVFTESSTDIVAVVNPPRAGLGTKFIKELRNCEAIKKVVYISCKPHGRVLSNFLGLMKPAHSLDEKITGEPFLITETAAVDMFPHTKHFELILLFER